MCQVSVVLAGKLEAVIVVKSTVVAGHTFAFVVAVKVGAVVPAIQVGKVKLQRLPCTQPEEPPVLVSVTLVNGVVLLTVILTSPNSSPSNTLLPITSTLHGLVNVKVPPEALVEIVPESSSFTAVYVIVTEVTGTLKV